MWALEEGELAPLELELLGTYERRSGHSHHTTDDHDSHNLSLRSQMDQNGHVGLAENCEPTSPVLQTRNALAPDHDLDVVTPK